MAPPQISQHSFESCPIAKSPQGSPNPRQPLKRVRMKLFWTKRTEKGQVSKSQAPSSPLAQSQGAARELRPEALQLMDRQRLGRAGRTGRSHTSDPRLSPAAQKTPSRVTGCPLRPPVLASGISHSPAFWQSNPHIWHDCPGMCLGPLCMCVWLRHSIPTSVMESNTNRPCRGRHPCWMFSHWQIT